MNLPLKVGAQARLSIKFDNDTIAFIDAWNLDEAIVEIFKLIKANLSQFIFSKPLKLIEIKNSPVYYLFFEKGNKRIPVDVASRGLYYIPLAPYPSTLGSGGINILELIPDYEKVCVDEVTVTRERQLEAFELLREINNSKEALSLIFKNSKSAEDQVKEEIFCKLNSLEKQFTNCEIITKLKEILS